MGFSINDDETTCYTQRPADFASDEWFGSWVSKDLGVYVDIEKQVEVPAFTSNLASITLQGGTAEGSVYVNAITIQYDEPQGATLESPLGWDYEKLTKKSTLTEGDEYMIFRNGCAAGKQSLAWDEGSTAWNITLGYDGATITNAESKYGTLRYNAPAESYARFNVYTSTSLPLPFLYRKTKQQQPVVARSLTFSEAAQTVNLNDGSIALKPQLMPTTTTDQRLCWSSSNTQVATVNGGYVMLHSVGDATITATTADGGATTTMQLHVTDNATGIQSVTFLPTHQTSRKYIQNNRVVISSSHGTYDVMGKQIGK